MSDLDDQSPNLRQAAEDQSPAIERPTFDEMISRFVSLQMNARAAEREKQILGIVRPRPWWMPPPVWRYLLKRLVVIAIVQKRVPFTFGPVDLSFGHTYAPESWLRLMGRYDADKPFGGGTIA